ncbi:MAG: MBL fold metallo-hydrolase [Dehalococcoidia bacterium]|nr:MBL fold metallo-hydrolase [Dehalococcoidia bacterium]
MPETQPRFFRKWLVPFLLVVSILVWSLVFTLPDGKLHVSLLDVGQGDAILVQTPSGQNILIDGGPDSQKLNLELGCRIPFWDRTMDLVISTQPHADHVTGLVEVLQRYEVKQVLWSDIDYDSFIYREWLDLIEEGGIERCVARRGQEIDLGDGIKMEVLNPPVELFRGTSSDVDNNGVVLKLSWNKVSFLFTADIRKEAEFELIKGRPGLRSTVLKVAHHGSVTSTSPQFLAVVEPEVAAISVGADNNFGHPGHEVVERLVEMVGENNLFRTDEDGTIEFITDGERLWVEE